VGSECGPSPTFPLDLGELVVRVYLVEEPPPEPAAEQVGLAGGIFTRPSAVRRNLGAEATLFGR
jgi:hypothetical protein